MNKLQKFLNKYLWFIDGDKKFNYLLETRGVIRELKFKGVSVEYQYYPEIMEMDENQILANYTLTVELDQKTHKMNLVEFYDVRWYDPTNGLGAGEEHRYKYDMFINARREDFDTVYGESLSKGLEIEKEEAKVFKKILMEEFDILRVLENIFKEQRIAYTKQILNKEEI